MTVKTLTKEPFNLIVAGVGGQGNVLMSMLIGMALVREGYFIGVSDTYGASQRGGSVASHIRISKETQYSYLIPTGHADFILGMEPVETLRMLGQFGNPDVMVIINPRPVYPPAVITGAAEYPDLDELMETIKKFSARSWVVNATDEAMEMGNPIFANMILVGALIGTDVLPLDRKSMEPVLRERFSGKRFDDNMVAFDKGMELVRQ